MTCLQLIEATQAAGIAYTVAGAFALTAGLAVATGTREPGAVVLGLCAALVGAVVVLCCLGDATGPAASVRNETACEAAR